MAGLEALPCVQCVSAKGERFAVVHIEDWEARLEWLETWGDVPIAPEAYATRRRRERAGWLREDEVKRETFGSRQTFCFV